MTAPASPRVAEELVEKAERMAWKMIRNRFDNRTGRITSEIANLPEVITAIITLAQDAKLREVAEWAQAERDNLAGKQYGDFANGKQVAFDTVRTRARAMMVKP